MATLRQVQQRAVALGAEVDEGEYDVYVYAPPKHIFAAEGSHLMVAYVRHAWGIEPGMRAATLGELLERLRATTVEPCDRPDCTYCADQADAV